MPILHRIFGIEVNEMVVTKRMVEDMFLQNVPDAKIEVLTEEPQREWKHCCCNGGVSVMSPQIMNQMGVLVKYALCPYCHKIIYIADYSGAIPFKMSPDGFILPSDQQQMFF